LFGNTSIGQGKEGTRGRKPLDRENAKSQGRRGKEGKGLPAKAKSRNYFGVESGKSLSSDIPSVDSIWLSSLKRENF